MPTGDVGAAVGVKVGVGGATSPNTSTSANDKILLAPEREILTCRPTTDGTEMVLMARALPEIVCWNSTLPPFRIVTVKSAKRSVQQESHRL